MALSRPTLKQLRTRAVSDMQSALRLTAPLGPYLRALCHAVAGAAHGLYGYVDNIGKQLTPATATGVWLERWASLWKYTRKPAAVAGGDITLTGVNSTTVPDGLYLQSGDGTVYVTTAGGTISGGEITVAARADAPGTEGNLEPGESLTLISPTSGIDSAASVPAPGILGGRDIEADDELRSRLIQRLTNPPHGGNKADYELWALAVPGITRAWCVPRYNGDGSVRVYVGEADPSGPDLASAALVSDALDYIEDQRPVSYSDLDVTAPTIQTQDITLNVTPDTGSVHTAVEAELAALFDRDAEPDGTIYLSRINEAISIAAGESDHLLITPSADVTADSGKILTLGSVTFT